MSEILFFIFWQQSELCGGKWIQVGRRKTQSTIEIRKEIEYPTQTCRFLGNCGWLSTHNLYFEGLDLFELVLWFSASFEFWVDWNEFCYLSWIAHRFWNTFKSLRFIYYFQQFIIVSFYYVFFLLWNTNFLVHGNLFSFRYLITSTNGFQSTASKRKTKPHRGHCISQKSICFLQKTNPDCFGDDSCLFRAQNCPKIIKWLNSEHIVLSWFP